jgi:hypothetical protein
MPQIPTIQSGSSLLGRSASLSEASPTAFGSQVGEATQRFGNQLSNTVAVAAQIVSTKKSLEADKYANDAMTQLRDYYSQKMADPEVNSSESYADDLQKEMQKSLSDWEAKAPTKEARQLFREQFQRFSSSRYEVAAVTTVRTQMDNMLQSHDSQNGSVIRGYETDRLVPNLDANQELVQNIQGRFTDIDAALGKIAPDKAKALKSNLLEDAAYSTMNYSPSTARKILAMGSGMLDGRRVHAIESQIKTAEEAAATTDVIALNRIGGDAITLAHKFGNQAELKLTDIQGLTPDKKANVLLNDWNTQIRAGNAINEFANRVKPWNGNAQLEYLDELEKKIGTSAEGAKFDNEVFTEVKRRIHENYVDYSKDSGGYLIKNNPSAAALAKNIAELEERDKVMGAKEPNPMIRQKNGELTSLLLFLQSKAPDDSNEKLHSVVPRSQLMVMSKAKAQASVSWINNSSPQEAVSVIQSVVKDHPGNEGIAFANLVQNNLDLGYWGLYKNQKNSRLPELVGALQFAKESKELNRETSDDVAKALNPGMNPKWDAWKRLFPDDYGQRTAITAGMQRAITAHATMQMSQKKMSAKAAVADAVDTWLYSEMALASVNGQPILLDRRVGDRPPMNDQETAMFGRRLSELAKVVSPKSIDDLEYHFPTIWGKNGLGNDMEKWEQTRQVIATRGFFKPAGEYSTLYLQSDTGQPFEARSNGQAIAVKNEEVPTFLEKDVFRGAFGLTATLEHLKPLPVTPIFEKKKVVTEVPFAPDTPAFRSYKGYTKNITTEVISTNWPVEPDYIRRIAR